MEETEEGLQTQREVPRTCRLRMTTHNMEMGANMILGQRYWTTNGHDDEDFFFGCFIDYCILIVGFCISLFLYLYFISISPFHSFSPFFCAMFVVSSVRVTCFLLLFLLPSTLFLNISLRVGNYL